MPRCQVTNGYGYPCGNPAVFAVYWLSTGKDAIATCGKHVAKAIGQLKASTNNGYETTFKIHVLEGKA